MNPWEFLAYYIAAILGITYLGVLITLLITATHRARLRHWVEYETQMRALEK